MQTNNTKSAPRPHAHDVNRAEHNARYLVLFGNAGSPRAALFDAHERFMAEMIGDDGYAVDSLVRSSSACAPPCPAMVDAIEAFDERADLAQARCFRLG